MQSREQLDLASKVALVMFVTWVVSLILTGFLAWRAWGLANQPRTLQAPAACVLPNPDVTRSRVTA
jgi:hypothetical protein